MNKLNNHLGIWLIVGLTAAVLISGCTRVWVRNDRPIVKEYPFPEKVTTINGIDVHYIEEGVGQPIIFIHGLGGSLDNWVDNIPYFSSKGFKVVSHDQPGFGKSSKPPTDYTMDLFIDTAHELMKRCDEGKWIVVGNSMGGLITTGLALKYPEQVKAIVLVDAAGAHGPFGPTIQKIAEAVVSEEYLYNLTEKQIDSFNRRIFYRPNERYRKMWEGWLAIRNSREFPGFAHAFVSAALNILKTTYVDRLGSVEAPALIVWGKQDNLPLDYGYRFKKGIKNSTLVIMDKSSHVPMSERAEDFNPIVQLFAEAPGKPLKESLAKFKDVEVIE